MQFKTSEYYEWQADKSLKILDSAGDIYIKGYKGVTRVIDFGEETFKERLTRQMGKEKANKVLNKVRTRGNNYHKVLETRPEELINSDTLAKLGKLVASEVVVYGDLFGLKVIGFIDAIYQNSDGSYSLIDYKTKSNKSNFHYYNPQKAINKAFMQLVAYAALTKMTYDANVSSVKIVNIYKDKPLENDLYELPVEEFLPFASTLVKKIKGLLAQQNKND